MRNRMSVAKGPVLHRDGMGRRERLEVRRPGRNEGAETFWMKGQAGRAGLLCEPPDVTWLRDTRAPL